MKTTRKKVAITLAYLQNNLGDDLFVQHLCLRYPDVDFYVMEMAHHNKTLETLQNLHFSKEMKKYFKLYGLENISKKAKKFYDQFDACVMIGGSIFMQDNQYWRGKLRSFRNRATLNQNSYVIGANFGPFNDPRFLTEFTWAFTKLKDLCFRDSTSASYFPDSAKIRYAPDILFSYKHESQVEEKQIAISVINPSWEGRPSIQLKRLKKCAQEYIEKIVEICSEAARRNEKIVLLSFSERQGDLNVAKRIESKCLNNGITNIEICSYSGDVKPILDEISKSKAIIATRFHAMILGFLFGKAVYPIIYDEKQKYVLQDLNFYGKSCLIENVGEVDSKEVLDCLLNADTFNSYSSVRTTIEKCIIDSEQQFLALDKILKEDGD